jgi:hypothetical protein
MWNETKNDTSKDFSTVNETRKGHEAWNSASCIMTMICRLIEQFDETVEHVISACWMSVKEQCMKINDRLCAQLHFNVWKELGVKLGNEHWQENVPKLTEISREVKITILWNRQVKTDRTIPKKKLDVIISDNEKGTRMLMDVRK